MQAGNVVAFDPSRRRVREREQQQSGGIGAFVECVGKIAEQQAASRVRDYLRGRVGPTRLAEAEARAERRVRSGNTTAEAISFAVRWALSSTDFDPLPPAA
jgi:hypothetical protein